MDHSPGREGIITIRRSIKLRKQTDYSIRDAGFQFGFCHSVRHATVLREKIIIGSDLVAKLSLLTSYRSLIIGR